VTHAGRRRSRFGNRLAAATLAAGAAAVLGLGLAPTAAAHPLGNATVNHYDGLTFYQDHIEDLAVEDVAEIPTYQRKATIDANGDGKLSAGERAAYARSQCRALSRADRIVVGGHRLSLSVSSSSYTERPSRTVRGLFIGRLSCHLRGDADLSHAATVSINDNWDGSGIGWHEITAVGHGVSLKKSPVPAKSISDALRHYPNNLLSSPLQVRSATIHTVPGGGASTYLGGQDIPVAGFFVRQINKIAGTFESLVGAQHVTLGVGLLALVLSLALGAGHAFLPGHGKTIMAAYLVGRRGRLRDVVTVGATVTITHTAGVLILGLALAASASFAPTAVEQILGVTSGLIVAAVGVWLLVTAIRRRLAGVRPVADSLADLPVAEPAAVASGPAADVAARQAASITGGPAVALTTAEPVAHRHGWRGQHVHAHEASRDHGHEHDLGHGHEHGHDGTVLEQGHSGKAGPVLAPARKTAPAQDGAPATGRPFGRGGLLGLGIAGGLVPSPSAVLVLLAAVALGRTVFGVALVVGYGVGMASALTAAGLLLVRMRGRLDRALMARRFGWLARVADALPLLTGVLVLLVGVGLALRAVSGSI
jgi:ABC-type nickel/cobalt efflux system permease component RcnA